MTARRPRPLRALWLGFGNVGRAAADILVRRDEYPGTRRADVAVIGIVTGTHGTARGRRAASTSRRPCRTGARDGRLPDPARRGTPVKDAREAVAHPRLRRPGRDDAADPRRRAASPPSRTCARRSRRGRHVVTANKGPLAWAFPDLAAPGRGARRGSSSHETAVMDGVPVFNLARHGLRGATVSRVEGILNSTTNAILGALERGGTFEDGAGPRAARGVRGGGPARRPGGMGRRGQALRPGPASSWGSPCRRRGSRARGSPASTRRAGRGARARGARLKLVARGLARRRRARAAAWPCARCPSPIPFALVEDTSSILRLVTDLAGTVVITEERPDIRVTAYGVISDLLAVDAAGSASAARPGRPARGAGSRSRPPRRAR